MSNVLRGAAVRSWPKPVAGALVSTLIRPVILYWVSANKASLAARLQDLRLHTLVSVANISGEVATIATMRYIPLSVSMLIGLRTPMLVFSLTYKVLENQERMTSQVMAGSAITSPRIAWWW